MSKMQTEYRPYPTLNSYAMGRTVSFLSLYLFVFCWMTPWGGAIEISDGVYEGRSQYVINSASATWYYDRAGGGFSRLIDRDGRDWISFSKDPLNEFPLSAAAGYRGLGNLVFGADNPDAGAGHPGFDLCESEPIASNVIHTRSLSGLWAWTWTFHEHTAEFVMEKAPPDRSWWFLYEGPIAGRYDPANQFWGTSEGGPYRDIPDLRNQRFGQWQWAYFGDMDSPRILFLVQHEPDELPDTFWYLGSSDGGAATAPDGMVVFGFGRGPGTQPMFRGAGIRIRVGFLEFEDGFNAHGLIKQESIEQAITNLLDESVSSEPLPGGDNMETRPD